MHPHNQSPFDQPGTGRHGGRRSAESDSFSPYHSEPGDSHQTAGSDSTQLYPSVPRATPQHSTPQQTGSQHTKVFPAVAPQGGDPGYLALPGPPVSPAPPPAAPPPPVGQYHGGYTPGSRSARTAAERQASRGSRYGSTLRGMTTELRIGLGNALAGVGGLLMVLFSFAPFVRYDDPKLLEHVANKDLPGSFSAWSLETFLAPLTWWVVFAALGLVAMVGFRLSAAPKDREFFGFRPGQIQVVLSLFGFLVLVGYALSAKTLVFGSELQPDLRGKFVDGALSLGWGGSLMLIGSLLAVVGSFLDHLGIGPTIWPRPAKPDHHRSSRGYDHHGSVYGQSAAGHPPPGHASPGYPQPGHAPSGHSVPYEQMGRGYR